MNQNDQKGKPFLSRRWLTIAGIVFATVILLVFIIINSNAINAWFRGVLRLFRPIIIGLVLAYLLNPVFRFFEQRMLRNLRPLFLRRVLALIFSYVFLLLIIALLFVLIVPQLITSITNFLSNYPPYLEASVERYNGFVSWLNGTLSRFKVSQSFLQPVTADEIQGYLTGLFGDVDRLTDLLAKYIPKGFSKWLISAVSGTVTTVTNVIFAFFISLYLLISKERLYAQTMKLRRGMFSDRVNSIITRVSTVADRSFGSFLEGKFFDSLIIGILTYVVLLIFRIPYPVLIAAIIGITNIVPIIGPIFGAIPTAIIVVLDTPAKVLPFLIIVLVIQQIDGNIIGPKILGSSNGVSSLCVLIAIMILGRLWGLVGMLIGVPLFATILDLLETFLKDRLRAKGLPSTTENYYPPDSPLDPATDMQSGPERGLRKWESKVLHLQILQADGKKIAVWDRFVMWLYQKARALSIVPEISPEAHAQFAIDEAIRAEENATKETKTEK